MRAVSRRELSPGEHIRVLVVDDSMAIRRLLTKVLEDDPDIDLAGVASDGSIALRRIPELNPDVVTLDIEMPGIDGIETLRRIRQAHPQVRVIMCSSLTERGAATTLSALSAGADDYICKVTQGESLDASIESFRQELLPKIKQFFVMAAQAQWSETQSRCRAGVVARSMQTAIHPRPRVIAIGVSTGGPAALTSILPQLPQNFSIPVLIVQHMPPLFTRCLAERLGGICSLPVEEAKQGMKVLPGRILIAPGDFHMRVASSGGATFILLDTSPPQNSCRPSVDVLFDSVERVYGGAAIAAVLTGMGRDGLRGAGLLKRRGATVIAQDEASSVVWGMPGAIVQEGLADRVLPLERIIPEVVALARYGGVPGWRSPVMIAPTHYRFLQDRVYAQSGIVLGEGKQYLFETRLSPIIRDLGLASINDLCALLQATGEATVVRQVVEAMTTNETYFFRDPVQYDAIRKVLLPRLREERSETKKLRFWSAAASHGQEAYSLAMLLREDLRDWDVRITGTDFSSAAIEKARAGKYQQIEVNRGLPAALLVRYFRRNGIDWLLDDTVRRMVSFEVSDLRRMVRTAGPYDLVFCRNVLIYFDAETKRDILQQLHGTLFRGGWLLLGGAETAFGVDQWFEQQHIGNATVYVAK